MAFCGTIIVLTGNNFKHMKIVGIILILGGLASLMINLGFSNAIIGSVAAIIAGFMLKHGCGYGYGRCGGMGSCKGGSCGMKCGEGSHKCTGAGCATCKTNI